MSKPQDSTLISSAATNRTPNASLLDTNQENQEQQSAITASQINDNRLMLSSNTSMMQEIISMQALHVLKLQDEDSCNGNGAAFTLLADKEIADKLSSMTDQIQGLSSTVCILTDDIFKKSALIADLTKQLQLSERERVRLSTVQNSAPTDINENSLLPLATESNLPINIASSAPSFQTNQSDSTPPVSTFLTNEPAIDLTPPLAAPLSLSDPPDGAYEPESPICCHRSNTERSIANNICQSEKERDYVVEITELKALLSNQDHLINALVTIVNEEADLIKILLSDETHLPEDVNTIPHTDKSIDVIKEAGIQLTRDDSDLHRSVKTKMIELQELRFSMKLLSNVKQETDDRLVVAAQKVSMTLSKFERMFCYFVILGLCALLFSQWVVNPWKYN